MKFDPTGEMWKNIQAWEREADLLERKAKELRRRAMAGRVLLGTTIRVGKGIQKGPTQGV